MYSKIILGVFLFSQISFAHNHSKVPPLMSSCKKTRKVEKKRCHNIEKVSLQKCKDEVSQCKRKADVKKCLKERVPKLPMCEKALEKEKEACLKKVQHNFSICIDK